MFQTYCLFLVSPLNRNICLWVDWRTQMAAGVPEGLWVEVAGVHAVRGGVDTRELALVELHELHRLLLH